MAEKINTMLFGEKPVRAEFVFCDKHNKCDLFKKGTCLNVTKVIPNLLFECRKRLPDIWAEFIKTYPAYEEVLPNHVGRYALLRTLSRECKYFDCHGNAFEWDGEWLACKNYTRGFTPFDCKKDVECRFKPGEQRYKVTRNDEVTEDTVFV